MKHPIVKLLLLCLFISCVSDPETPGIEEFQFSKNYSLACIASEPLISSPVAISENIDGSIFIAEMTGYMRDVDGSDEEVPDGRIVRIIDRDNSGVYETREVIIENIVNPRVVSLAYGGILFTDGAHLKWVDLQSVRSKVLTVDSFYIPGGNIEHQANGLVYGIDNWYYSANSNIRYRRINEKWIKETTHFRGQWGISIDEKGRLIYNNNSTPLISDLIMPNLANINPYNPREYLYANKLTENFSISPIRVSAVNRGYEDGVLDSNGYVLNYTSACSPLVFYGNGLQNHYNHLFVCAPEGNLISSYFQDSSGTFQDNPPNLLVSKNETFRPIFLSPSLDGSLLIVDLRKGVIQHRAYMTEYLREKILEKGLDKVVNLGRIYKLSRQNSQPKQEFNSDNLIENLYSENFHHRLLAQRLLLSNKEGLSYEKMKEIINSTNNIKTIVHLIWLIEEMGENYFSLLKNIIDNHDNYLVINNLLSFSLVHDMSQSFIKQLLTKVNSENLQTKILTGLVAGKYGLKENWKSIADKYGDDPIIAEALLSNLKPEKIIEFGKTNTKNNILHSQFKETIKNMGDNVSTLPKIKDGYYKDGRTAGFKLYKQYCSSCHGIDGKGLENLAPNLFSSLKIEDDILLASTILFGYQSDQSDYAAAMPAFKDDPSLNSEKIRDLILFIKNAMTTSNSSITISQIDSIKTN